MKLLKQLKYLLFFLLALLLGTQTTYAKIELVLTQVQLSFSIEKKQSFTSLEKEVQPNIGFLKEKSKFGKSNGSSTRINCNFSKCFVESVAKAVVNNIDDFAKLSKAQKLSYIEDAWKAYYPQIFFERKLFEDMMGKYRYLKKSGWGHTDEIASNFKAIDFYKDFTKIENEIIASKVVSMKTTTTTNVDNWLKSNPIKNNLNNLVEYKGLDKGITWNATKIKYNNAEVHIYMKKANITPLPHDCIVWYD